jgi:hypothetical protein
MEGVNNCPHHPPLSTSPAFNVGFSFSMSVLAIFIAAVTNTRSPSIITFSVYGTKITTDKINLMDTCHRT